MKIAQGFSLMNIIDSNVVVPVGERNLSFKGMVTLNESGAFLWRQLEKDTTKDELIEALLQEYEVDRAAAEWDIDKFINTLKAAEILE